MKKKQTVALVSTGVVASIGAVVAAGGSYFYRQAVSRNSKAFISSGEDNFFENYENKREENLEWVKAHQYKEFTIKSRDGMNLHGYYIPGKTNQLMILAHGYGMDALSMTFLAKYYLETYGFSVLMPDARGHGLSEGDYIGMGWPEREDYVSWIDFMIAYHNQTIEIALHGISMGGATVMNVSGEPLPNEVKFIIEDCGYTSAEDIFAWQAKSLYHIPKYPILPVTSQITKVKAGYHFKEASSMKQVKKATLPMLFVHGGQDEFVPTSMVYRLFTACGSIEKNLCIVSNAKHGNSFFEDEFNQYRQWIDIYVLKYFNVKK